MGVKHSDGSKYIFYTIVYWSWCISAYGCKLQEYLYDISHVQLFATPWTVACQVSPSMKISGKNTGVDCLFLLTGLSCFIPPSLSFFLPFLSWGMYFTKILLLLLTQRTSLQLPKRKGGGINQKFGIKINTLLYLKYSKDLLYSIGNYTQDLIVTYNGKVSKKNIDLDICRQWQPTPVLLPGKSHGQRSLVGCSPWGH